MSARNSMVECRTFNPRAVGSSPTAPTIRRLKKCGLVAQLAEQGALNAQVLGSKPSEPTNRKGDHESQSRRHGV